MTKDKELNQLSNEEAKLKLYWNDIVKYTRRDLAYVWTDEVKRDFEEIKKEARKIAFFLKRFHTYYKKDKVRYYKEISDIRKLLYHLNRIESKAKWVIQIHNDLQQIILDIENLAKNKLFWTVQGLNSISFLCCHITNVGGGAGAYLEAKKDPFENIVNDVNNTYDYNPSIFVIGSKTPAMGLVDVKDFGGYFGVVYDYGYIYQAYAIDAGSRDIIGKKSGKVYRTGPRFESVEPFFAVIYSTSKYNELLIRNWTVSGLFYTKSCKEWVIEKLQKLSDELSFKEYVDGAYLYRTTKSGASKKTIKIFPMYEIDTVTNNWKVVYFPKNQNYDIKIDKPNNTWVAIPK